MSLWRQFQVVWRSLGCREAWRLPPALALRQWRLLSKFRPERTPQGRWMLLVNAPAVGGPAHGRYLAGLRRQELGERLPLSVHLAVTDRCPCQCPGCSNAVNLEAAFPEPTLEALSSLVAACREAGCAFLCLTGGEPLLHPDLESLVRLAAPVPEVSLFTTGWGLTPERATALRQAGLAAAFVSLDHPEAELHDRQRGISGAFGQALAAVRYFREAEVYAAVQARASDSLLDPAVWDRFVSLCTQAGAHEIMLLEPVAVAAGSPPGLELTEAGRQRLLELHAASLKSGRGIKVSSSAFVESPDCLGCQAGISFLSLNTAGDAFPCDFLRDPLGNVRRDGFPAILAEARRRYPVAVPTPRCCKMASITSTRPAPDLLTR